MFGVSLEHPRIKQLSRVSSSTSGPSSEKVCLGWTRQRKSQTERVAPECLSQLGSPHTPLCLRFFKVNGDLFLSK